MRRLSCLFLVLVLACGKSEERSCAEGLLEKDGECVLPEGQCGAGFVWDGTQCVGLDTLCGEGSILVDGECVPEVTSCGPGTYNDNGVCRPNPPADPDVFELDDPSQDKLITLPTVGTELVLGGVIDEPTDVNGDTFADPDLARFAFQIAVPTRLRLDAWSERDGQPSFIVVSSAVDENGQRQYGRYCIDPNALGCEREVYLPKAGRYEIWISDYANFWPQIFGTAVIPVGGPDFIYRLRITTLPAPTASTLATLPLESTRSAADGSLAYYRLDSLASHYVIRQLAADPTNGGDIYPTLLLVNQATLEVRELRPRYLSVTSVSLLEGRVDEPWLVVDDFDIVTGPRREVSFDISDGTPVDCSATDCSGDALGSSHGLFRWDLQPGDLLGIRVTTSADGAYYTQWLDEDLMPVGSASFATEAVTVKATYYAGGAETILLWISPYPTHDGTPFNLAEGVASTPELVDGAPALLGLDFARLPAGPADDVGYAHVVVDEGDVFIARDFLTSGVPSPRLEWASPNNRILGPPLYVDASGASSAPLLARAPVSGHYLARVTDATATTDLAAATFNLGVDIVTPIVAEAQPTSEASVVQELELVSEQALGVLVVEGAASSRWQVSATSVDAEREVAVWVFATGFHTSSEGGYLEVSPYEVRQALLAEVVADVGQDAVVEVPVQDSDVPHLIVVRDFSASPSGFATVTVSLVEPPLNDACADAELLALSTPSSGQTRSATPEMDPSDTCASAWASGSDVFYRIEVGSAGTLNVTVTPTTSVQFSAYLLSSCAADACLAYVNDTDSVSASGVALSQPVVAGTYYLGIDGRNSMVGFDFEVTATVE